ncbi:MAG: heat-inducible transcriptional repressor HrcA [Chlamydiae bacterium]|jgi:heat-inducible transcriptional repressor|nr:heat-inducible transcriptional repressor HrcA [Chlamydiota bacterium]
MGKVNAAKKISRKDRERDVLLGLVDLYVKQGKPIGSHTLQEEGFDHLSSATIRNYFAKLEMEGFLKQHHTSGGRAPTDKAFRIYAEDELVKKRLSSDDDLFLSTLILKETKAIPSYLQKITAAVSELTGCATFLISPKFDQDFIVKIKLVAIDDERILCAILTDFGQVHTEVMQISAKISQAFLKSLEDYFHYRLTGQNKQALNQEEELIAKAYYNEIVLRHFVSYTNMQSDEVYKAGFSKLLLYPEFHDPEILSNTLSLFENSSLIKPLFDETFTQEKTKFWIGDDLAAYISPPYYASLIAVPYQIGEKTVGVLATLGPDRLPYGKVFSILENAARYLSDNLTKSLYKFKLTYRKPKSKALDMKHNDLKILRLTHENSNE